MSNVYTNLNSGSNRLKITPRLVSNGVTKTFAQFEVELSAPTLGLSLTWDDIANVPVSDVSSVSDWNVFFSGSFTSVIVTRDEVKLIGSCVTLKSYLWNIPEAIHLLEFDDETGMISNVLQYAFNYYIGGTNNLTKLRLPNCVSIGFQAIAGKLTEIYIPKCTTIGTTHGNDYVFLPVIGNTITLTIPSTLMTCNGGAPDGDIQYLIDNNILTIIQV